MNSGNGEERTLVIHLGGIGDFLLACPALSRLAEEGPVELMGRPDRLALGVEGGIAERAHDIEDAAFASLFSEPSQGVRDVLARFSRVVAWMRGDDVEPQLMEGRRTVQFFPGLPPKDWDEHASLYYLSCLGFDDPGPFCLDVGTSGEVLDVVIHPGSGGRKKNWPLENFVALAGELENSGRTVTWRRGPAEEEMVLPEEVDVLEVDSLVELARQLAGARLYVGNDSGITHLAAAVGCATVAVFGPTDARVWGPRGRAVRIVEGAPWPSVTDVVRGVEVLEER